MIKTVVRDRNQNHVLDHVLVVLEDENVLNRAKNERNPKVQKENGPDLGQETAAVDLDHDPNHKEQAEEANYVTRNSISEL